MCGRLRALVCGRLRGLVCSGAAVGGESEQDVQSQPGLGAARPDAPGTHLAPSCALTHSDAGGGEGGEWKLSEAAGWKLSEAAEAYVATAAKPLLHLLPRLPPHLVRTCLPGCGAMHTARLPSRQAATRARCGQSWPRGTGSVGRGAQGQ